MSALKIIPLKTVYGGSSYSFSEQSAVEFTANEFEACEISTPKTIIKQDSQNTLGRLFDKKFAQEVGYEGNILTIDIIHYYSTTQGKIEGLMDNDYTGFKVYYRNEEEPTTFKYCALSKETTKSYAFGNESAYVVTRLIFYEIENDANIASQGDVVTVELIIDPDGERYKLDGLHDVIDISPINNSFDLMPESLEELVLSDLYVKFNDYNQFLSPISTNDYAPFRYGWSTLKSGITSASTSLTLTEDGTTPFKVGDKVTVTDGNNSDTFFVDSVDVFKDDPGDSDSEEHQVLNFDSGSITNSYSAGAVVTIDPYYGKEVILQIRYKSALSGVGTQVYIIFKGVIREPFTFSGDSAVLRIDNVLSQYLNIIPTINAFPYQDPVDWLNSSGSFESSIRWSTQTGSGALSGVTVYEGASIGQWTVEFTSATNFKVTGPGVFEKVGSTASDFYDQTDATDSQILIPSANWSGTPSTADVLLFNVAINFPARGVVSTAKALIVSFSGAANKLFDSKTFKTINIGTLGEYYNFSFGQVMTLGEMVITTMKHVPGYIFQTCGGLIGFDWLKTKKVKDGPSELNPQSIGASVGPTRFYNDFVIRYGWNSADGETKYQYTYPERDSENPSLAIFGRKVSVEYYLPFVYTLAEAQRIAKRLYQFWAFGQNVVTSYSIIPTEEVSMGMDVSNTDVSFENAISAFEGGKILGVTFDPTNKEIITKVIPAKDDVLGAW